MVEKAVAFAIKSHEGTFRKGTKIPYIVHPLETAVIVALMVTDEEMICAALLHDVVEDTGVTEAELKEEFGSRVAELVMEETEDKTKCWKERKSATLEHLEQASRESKILVLADKLSNLRDVPFISTGIYSQPLLVLRLKKSLFAEGYSCSRVQNICKGKDQISS